MKEKITFNERKSRIALILILTILMQIFMPIFTGMSEVYAETTETLLTTITPTGIEQASYSVENVATVSFSYTTNGSSAYYNNGKTNWGWWGYGWTATVTPADGYTITKCVFYDDKDRTATDSEAPFVVETTDQDKEPRVNGTPILANQSKGITKIEVYGYVQSKTATITLNTNGGTINTGNITEYEEGIGATLPTDVTKTGYTFAGWYDNENLTGSAVTSIGTDATGDKVYWAKWTSATCTVTFNPNGGRVSNKYPLQDLTVNKGMEFKLPSLPSLPEIAYIDAGMYIVVASPEGKVFDAFEVDGERKNPKDIITINNDTVIKYLWKDVTYIHEINLTIEAPIVGVKVDAQWNDVLDSLDYSTQTNRPIVTVPDGVNYMVEDEVTYWYDGDYNVFTGTIEKDTTYNATIYVCGITNEYQIADDVKITVNGKEITTFDNQGLWLCIDYSIDSAESSNKFEYTIESDTNSENTISFIAPEGDIYSFYIKDRLSTTDEDIQHIVDLFDDPEFTFEALKEQLDKLIAYGKNAAGEKGTLLKLYEMYLYNNGVEIHEIEGGFKLKIKITDDIKGYDLYKLVYIADDGSTEKGIKLTKNGEYLEATLPHLSMYALVGEKTENTTIDSNTKAEDTTETKTTSSPKTGDNITMYVIMFIISLLGIKTLSVGNKRKSKRTRR